MPVQRVCVFCGSSSGVTPAYAAAARELASELVARDLGLVYGGGHVGLMGVIADAVLAAGGEAIGVIPRSLVDREVGHTRLSQQIVVRTMHERKARMAELSSAFVAMPGGFGTLEEIFEAITWSQLGIHAKPCALFNVERYFDPLIAMVERAIEQGFIRREYRGLVRVAETASGVLDALSAPVPAMPRWIERAEP